MISFYRMLLESYCGGLVLLVAPGSQSRKETFELMWYLEEYQVYVGLAVFGTEDCSNGTPQH